MRELVRTDQRVTGGRSLGALGLGEGHSDLLSLPQCSGREKREWQTFPEGLHLLCAYLSPASEVGSVRLE